MLRSLARRNLREFFLSVNLTKQSFLRIKSLDKLTDDSTYLNLAFPSNTINQVRLLSKKKSPNKQKNFKTKTDTDEEDDYEDLEDDDGEDFISSIDTSQFRPGFKITQKHVASLRVDSILASGLNISRKKIDDSFYSGKLRLNGEKIIKKSHPVKENDRVDMIGEIDEKFGKRSLKRVFLYKIFEESSKNNKPKVVLISWKAGLFEEDAYKNVYE